ncbi:MAG TPA: phosphomethylpyrimidine synthase [Deltaproteobacteria bacterium]|nr:MAG: phosphomethylpyrimidine synthase [Deltaproteobacteria bacterium GWA2_55_82]OGQ62585.1 MAG: phosphomethylpyrimidine synthase [Deltaproteobacteria bacterium RIFCSPLOWO2_02_FULL_55_12]OIJ74174.1 MAG: phosphomethylpyrimidine synthase [Deltaproteobacteria bacterium GWC2_55_46]HBG46795.1 phosphomethylpyrimidine synthase [Deltaproteobacteria bacterium]HCY11196.1 phosphomethylpyrimidine synthase [Deltaproteobacteria bacterium]
MTQLEAARRGIVTEEMKNAALSEGVEAEYIRKGIEEGVIIITRNKLHRSIKGLAVGRGLRTKVNANIGSSQDKVDVNEELTKLRAAIEAGADAVMDLSTGGDVSAIRRSVMAESTVPIGTVPIYQAAYDARKKGKSFVEIDSEEMFASIEAHAEDGVDFVTVHCGVTRSSVEKVKKEGRIMGIVSRGGALTAEWMKFNKKENPLYEQYDRLIKIAKRYDMVLSLGDGLRPGCIADATDRGQVHELITLGELAKKAFDEGVQVMIEGPGHVPLDQIEANIILQKRLCNGAPFYVLGPLVTDIAPGYDHITSAIGGAIAAGAGADFLCYVTPSEHLRLPDVDDVREGVVACRIAAHAGDIAKKAKGAMEADIALSKARKALDWEGQIRLAIDPRRTRAIREASPPEDESVCTMCGQLCAIKIQK